MPLSASFGFFSPYLSEKKLLYQSFSHNLSFFSFLLFSSHLIAGLHSAPIFVILVVGNTPDTYKYNKTDSDFMMSHHHS